MATFTFRARDGRGALVEGTREAASEAEALNGLRQSGLFVLKIQPSIHDRSTSGPQFAVDTERDWRAFANAKSLSLFFRQLYSLLNAGASPARAMRSLAEHGSNPSLRRAAASISRVTGEGKPLSGEMRRYPGLFTPLMNALIEAGERGGFLDRSALKLAEYCERDFDLQQTIKRETLYPKILVLAAIFIPSAVTYFIAGPQAWRQQVIPPLIFLGSVVFIAQLISRANRLLSHGNVFSLLIDTVKLHFPVAGKIVRALAVTKFSQALAALYAGGVGPQESFEIAGAASGNAYIERRVREAAPSLAQGASFTEVIARTGQFPPMALQMLAIGEESGDIDTQLNKVADFLEREAETAIRAGVKIGGVLLFLGMAGYIGSIVAQYYIGYGRMIEELIGA